MKTIEYEFQRVRAAVINWQKLAPKAYPLTVVEALMEYFRITKAYDDTKEWQINQRHLIVQKICISLITPLSTLELKAAEDLLNRIAR